MWVTSRSRVSVDGAAIASDVRESSCREQRKEKRKDIISDFLEDLPLSDLRNVWFQHDGGPPHKVSSVQQYIRDTFQQQVIGHGGCVEWPPRSPDMNPWDFFLWGYIKQRVYANPPPTLQELRNRITNACASLSPAMREVQSRVQMRIVAKGHHFEHDR
ncbi:hypothetical protein AVEN_127542-1 [Araneus ventricosus]|uniref:Tc1-like transposase DDE domain-containing protein n=1 Tax=Araneus ventricosus TaxID=182803 RepID=A0A4Y2GAV3_ARAVE|nr:hypothetical protein AVEN_260458-1 [Araneus ventricosus]GBM50517.1 hypothetical protein AVEN_177921-1 [Araneus ventricosus]GBM60999.1 hypothetical protein AVEN_233473-1 [Araneus ventricosus]GBM61151.1 hypothetical protein AVEN_127542-1 [Araneus ventricosus]